jgi:flagellar FliJ protein
MKQFQFRLQKVMETTQIKEEIKKRELAKAMQKLRDNEAQLETLLGELEEHISHIESCHKRSTLKVSELSHLSGYMEKLGQEILAQTKKISRLTEEARVYREKLLEITKDKKVLERLKDKKYEEFKKKLRSMEQKFMDEVSTRSYVNGNNKAKGNGIMQ